MANYQTKQSFEYFGHIVELVNNLCFVYIFIMMATTPIVAILVNICTSEQLSCSQVYLCKMLKIKPDL